MKSGIDLATNFKFINETWCLITPLILMGIDILTGTIYAWGSYAFQSKKMRSGLVKKTGEIAIIVVGEVLSFSLGLPSYIMTCVCGYIVFMEIVSILENVDKMGAKIPRRIKDVINNAEQQINESVEYTAYEEQQIKVILEELKKQRDGK